MMTNEKLILSRNHELTKEEFTRLKKIEDFVIEFKAKCVYCGRPIEKGSIYVTKMIQTNLDIFYIIDGLPKRNINFECLPEDSDCSLAGTLGSVLDEAFNWGYNKELPDEGEL